MTQHDNGDGILLCACNSNVQFGSVGELTDEDPFALSMDGGAVPWEPVKEALV
ncbi:hypothetical protein ACWDZW_11775 [Streptomyces coeruleorubidus]